MSGFLRHVTTMGERWDRLAARYYGNPFAYERILAANPDVAMSPILSAAIVLAIPIVEAATVTDNSGLPPWKQ